MAHSTAVLDRAKRRAAEAAARRATALEQVEAGGHGGRVVPGDDGMVQVVCACGRYRSAPGGEPAARRAWLSHAMRVVEYTRAAS